MSLIYWWPLTEDLTDKIQGKTFEQNDYWNIIENGKIGKCAKPNYGTLDTGDSSVTPPTQMRVKNITIPETFSLAIWVKNNQIGNPFTFCPIQFSNGDPYFQGVANKGWDFSHNSWRLVYNDGANFYGGRNSGSGSQSYWGDNLNTPLNEWYHVAFTVNRITNKTELFINGISKGVRDIPIGLGSFGGTYELRFNWVQGWLLNGALNDLRIYDHVLSKAEIQELKKALVVHYTFDDELATSMLCNETGYYVKNTTNNVEYTATSAAVGTKSIYCKDGLQRITSLVPQCASDNLTMSAWFKSSNSLPRNNYHIVATIDAGRVEISVPTTGNLRWGGYNTPDGGTIDRFCGEVSAGLLDNQWHLLTIVYDGTGWLGYVDSVYKGKQTCSGPITYTEKKLIIGRYYDDTTSNYGATDAYIDDIRIYNSALSPEDIKDLYNCGGRISNLGDAFTGKFIEDAASAKINKNHTIQMNEFIENDEGKASIKKGNILSSRQIIEI